MKYNPKIHHRRSIRLRGYDYAKEGMYFITICTQHRIHFFGEVENGSMKLNEFGKIAQREWEKLPERWPHIALGAYQIMPNHMHGIIIVGHPSTQTDQCIYHLGASLVVAPYNVTTPEIPFSKIQWATRPYLGQILGAYSSIVATACLEYHKEILPGVWLDKIWQRGFDERIIRNAEAFKHISWYIKNNPKNWKMDQFNDSP